MPPRRRIRRSSASATKRVGQPGAGEEPPAAGGTFPATRISWIEFPAGPQMLEALNVGSIDLGSTGDIPPIFAQAAGADLLYVGVEPPKPKAEVIRCRKTARSKPSPI